MDGCLTCDFTINTIHFLDLQLQLSFSTSIVRVINYCGFRSQNNSDSLLTNIKRSDYLNA